MELPNLVQKIMENLVWAELSAEFLFSNAEFLFSSADFMEGLCKVPLQFF